MKKSIVFFSVLFFLFGCKEETKKADRIIEDNKPSIVHALSSPSGLNSQLPRLFSHEDELYLSWVEQKDSIAILQYSVFKNGTWNGVHPIVSGSDWFTNWADFPAIAVNSRGDVLTNYLQKSADGTYTYDIKLNLYTKRDRSWKKSFKLHSDTTKSEHGFVSMRPYAANSFMVTWLDGRETVGKAHGGGEMTLRGALVFEDGTIDYDTLLDKRVCDCCQTATAIGANDRIIVAYRDRSEQEIRDISVVHWTKENNWSTPKSVGDDQWTIAGCPVNGPAIDAIGNSVALAWFTGAQDEAKVNIAFSKDGATHFGKVTRVDAGNATGRVDVVLLSETEAAVLWMEPKGDEELIQLVKVTAEGHKGLPITMSKTSAERASGFPQLEKVGDSLFVAWTNIAGETSQIEMALVSISDL